MDGNANANGGGGWCERYISCSEWVVVLGGTKVLEKQWREISSLLFLDFCQSLMPGSGNGCMSSGH
jgi:hypothetical protein